MIGNGRGLSLMQKVLCVAASIKPEAASGIVYFGVLS